MLIFSTFITGLDKPISEILKDKINAKIERVFDGAILYHAKSINELTRLKCFHNSYQVIDFVNTPKQNAINHMANKILRSKNIFTKLDYEKKYKTFRIVTSCENQLTTMDKSLKNSLESLIAKATNLKPDRASADIEFWILYRSEGVVYFLKRLSKHKAYDKLLNKGELHPELAYIMNWISSPANSDCFLDPFCGYGAIPYQRMMYFPAQTIYAFDNNQDRINDTLKKLKQTKQISNIYLKNVDILQIQNIIQSQIIDKIVTDPPWGIFDMEINISDFYKKIMTSFLTIIKNNGIIVILTSKKEEFKSIVSEFKQYLILEEYNILVSGKKAAIYKIIVNKGGEN